MTTRSMAEAKSGFVTRYRVVVSILLAAAFAAIYIAFLSAREPEPTIVNPTTVLSVTPEDGATALRQSRIAAQLKAGYVGVLVVDGIEIPEDQLDHLEGSNWVGFTPGEGREIGELNPGNRCSVVVFWKPELTRSTAETFRWCWIVH